MDTETLKTLLKELTRKDILGKIDKDFYHHEKWHNLLINKSGTQFVSFLDGTMNFTYNSYNGAGNARQAPNYTDLSDDKYLVRVQFLNWKDLDFTTFKDIKTLRREIMNGDIKIHCTCASFHYHYSYTAYQQGANIEAQTIPSPSRADIPIFPRTKYGPPRGYARNPKPARGLPCKHLQVVLVTYPMWYSVVDAALKDKVKKLQKPEEQPSKDPVEINNPNIQDPENEIGPNIYNLVNQGKEKDEGDGI